MTPLPYDPQALELGAFVAAERRRLNWTQLQLGAKCGVSAARISQVENAVKPTPEVMVRRLYRVLAAG